MGSGVRLTEVARPPEALAAEPGDVHDVVGLAKNGRLLALAAPLCAEAAAEHAATLRFVRRCAWWARPPARPPRRLTPRTLVIDPV